MTTEKYYFTEDQKKALRELIEYLEKSYREDMEKYDGK